MGGLRAGGVRLQLRVGAAAVPQLDCGGQGGPSKPIILYVLHYIIILLVRVCLGTVPPTPA